MDLYFSPLACSMATRIALYEAGEAATYLEVDPKTKVVQKDGSDFRQVNPLGLVPTLRTDDGTVLTENAAILQYVADRFPKAGIGPTSATISDKNPIASVTIDQRIGPQSVLNVSRNASMGLTPVARTSR